MPPRILRLTNAEMRIFPDPPALARATAAELVRLGREAIGRHGRFDLALAGGSTPRGVYRLLAAEHGADLPWDIVHLFFGDEREVPPDHADSNYRMVRESLLVNPDIRARVHRIEAELGAAAAADRYETELRTHFQVPPHGQPCFDVILLGLGTDGHTASLFPGTSALEERQRAVVANPVPAHDTRRITLTFPCLNQARQILFLTAGPDKAAMLAKVLQGHPDGTTYPAQSVQPASGHPIWMTDESAASNLRAK